jgi:hypothetical protein
MRRVAISQSNYIPWKGYFDLIHDVDYFLFYDDVQFTKNDWRNRNKIKTPRGLFWLAIPVGPDLNRLICEVSIESPRWQIKHWKTILQYYSKAPFFENYREFLEQIYIKNEWHNLSELNQFVIRTIALKLLGIKTNFNNTSDFHCVGKKQDRLISLLKSIRADVYISGPAAKAYLDPEIFRQEGIELVWKDYSGYPEYPQFHPPFEHGVSIIDLLLHTGLDAPYYIWGWRSGSKRVAKDACKEE